MRSENGIPRPFQPSNLAQELRDLKRKVAELESRRTFVSVERIVEGGTINENVGKQITDTVQKDIVIDGGNLGEGALDGQRMVGAIIETNGAANRGLKLDDTGFRGYDADGNRYMVADENGLEMTGSISTKGKTTEATPRDIAVRLTTVVRDDLLGHQTNNPSLVFDDGYSTDLGRSPGIYSADGQSLTIVGRDTIGGNGTFGLSVSKADLLSDDISIGQDGLFATSAVRLLGKTVTIGSQKSGILSVDANVTLLGNVAVNGNALFGPWIDLPLLNGWKITNANKMRPSYRTNGDTIEFRGSISGGTSNVIALMPTAVRALREENKVVPQYNTGWVNGTVSVAPDGYIRLDTYASNVYAVNLDFSYSRTP